MNPPSLTGLPRFWCWAVGVSVFLGVGKSQFPSHFLELINALQKSGLKVPKKFKLAYDDSSKSSTETKRRKKKPKKGEKSNDDHLAALAEADLATQVCWLHITMNTNNFKTVEGDDTNSDFDEENFEMHVNGDESNTNALRWIEESDVEIKQIFDEGDGDENEEGKQASTPNEEKKVTKEEKKLMEEIKKLKEDEREKETAISLLEAQQWYECQPA